MNRGMVRKIRFVQSEKPLILVHFKEGDFGVSLSLSISLYFLYVCVFTSPCACTCACAYLRDMGRGAPGADQRQFLPPRPRYQSPGRRMVSYRSPLPITLVHP
jgi:hypothetical protein